MILLRQLLGFQDNFLKMAERRQKLIESYYKNKINDVEILVDNIWDPHNVAALSRTADGFGISKINLYYTYNKFPNFSSVGKKSSASASKWVKFEKIQDIDYFVSEKKKEGFVFIGSDFSESSKDLRNFVFPDKCILVLGAESKGLSDEIRAICDKFIEIPMVGMTESYNVSVSGGIVMYELFKQKGSMLKSKRNIV